MSHVLDVWQVRIADDDWRTVDPHVAASCVSAPAFRPNSVRLGSCVVKPSLRYAPLPAPFTLSSPRRLAAAATKFRREAEALPLFSDQVRAAQPSPEEYVAAHSHRANQANAADRRRRAALWKRARAAIRAAPAEIQWRVYETWSRGMYPLHPEYLLELIAKTSTVYAGGLLHD